MYSAADSQHINNELLRRGSTTFGTLERRVSRLLRFLAMEYFEMDPQQRAKRFISQERARTQRQREETKAAWTLLGLRYGKTETFQSVGIPSIDAPSLSYLQNRGHWS